MAIVAGSICNKY